MTITQVAEQVRSIPESVLREDLKKELECMPLDLEAVKNKPKAEAGVVSKGSCLGGKQDVDVAITALPDIVSVRGTLS